MPVVRAARVVVGGLREVEALEDWTSGADFTGVRGNDEEAVRRDVPEQSSVALRLSARAVPPGEHRDLPVGPLRGPVHREQLHIEAGAGVRLRGVARLHADIEEL